MHPIITTFAWVPPFARGFVRDIRARWACEEVGQPYDLVLIRNAKTPEHRCHQPFGQVPTYRDENVEMFESGAIVLRIAERAGKLIPTEPAARNRAIQWLVAALNSVEPFVMALAVTTSSRPIANGRTRGTPRSAKTCTVGSTILRWRWTPSSGSTATHLPLAI